jgi:hypothetical protein
VCVDVCCVKLSVVGRFESWVWLSDMGVTLMLCIGGGMGFFWRGVDTHRALRCVEIYDAYT